MTQSEHIAWTKERALQELHYEGNGSEAKRIAAALTSVCSDIQKDGVVNEGTARTIIELGTLEVMAGTVGTVEQMERWIKGIEGG